MVQAVGAASFFVSSPPSPRLLVDHPNLHFWISRGKGGSLIGPGEASTSDDGLTEPGLLVYLMK